LDQASYTLARNLARLRSAGVSRYSPALARDGVLQRLVADLVAARTAAGMSQADVAWRMSTTSSTVSRLESGAYTRPTLRTIQRYALAVGAQVEIRLRIRGIPRR
jgi:ribosome-binding protein aMBF1 (putative translation factor)